MLFWSVVCSPFGSSHDWIGWFWLGPETAQLGEFRLRSSLLLFGRRCTVELWISLLLGSLSLGRSLKSIVGDGFSRGRTLFVLPSTFLGLDWDRLDDGGVIGNATRQRVVMIVLMGFVLVFHVRLGDGFRQFSIDFVVFTFAL